MTIGVKICGITSLEAVDAAIAAGAAYGGLVFHPRSPRFVQLEQAATLADRMRGRLKIVALIADMDDAPITTLVQAVRPDFLQLHGGETVQRTADIRSRFGVPVIKVLPVAEAADFDAVEAFEFVADMLMFDAKPPKGADRSGGHGAAFDWSLLKGRAFTKPWFLAGGLTPDNVARAVVLSQAAFVDVSSGVESAPGVKDAGRILQFVNATKHPVQA
ncbi:MAG: Phosphoribosylanthranilate isomerase [Alphaproteobacteria bacterium]|jgi:phosphoribosylanthranilate isomerase|nr:Phosphoribosylanthranilate isomerase [Alphaproteobacteria bacterium]